MPAKQCVQGQQMLQVLTMLQLRTLHNQRHALLMLLLIAVTRARIQVQRPSFTCGSDAAFHAMLQSCECHAWCEYETGTRRACGMRLQACTLHVINERLF